MLQFTIGVMLGILFGWALLRVLIYFRLKRILENIAEAPLPEPKKIDVDLVRIKDIVYAYTKDHREFLAQGATKDEIIGNLRHRFPNTTFMVTPSNLKDVKLDDPV